MPVGTQSFLTSALRKQLFSAQATAREIAAAQLRLATGRKVSSALDNPQNFFTARSLTNRQNDLMRLLDDMNQNIQVIKEADLGVKALIKQLDLMESYVDEVEVDLLNGTDPTLNDLILADDPDTYWVLNDPSSGTAENLGTGGAAIDGTYRNTPGSATDLMFLTGDLPTEFDGLNQNVDIPDSLLINSADTPARTVEMMFESDDPNGDRQVIYEEGGSVNALAVYVEDGRLYFNGTDTGDWGPVDISVEIEEGETYHAAFVFDGANQEFRAYLNGELVGSADTGKSIFPAHGNDVGIGAMNQNSYYHDGPAAGDDFYFKGRISDVALYNRVISEDDLLARYNATRLPESLEREAAMTELIEQYNLLVNDTQYRGVNLLKGDTMRTDFNETRSAYLDTEGQNLTTTGLGFEDIRFRSATQIQQVKAKIREARETLRTFGETLANDLTIIQTRENFTEKLINTLAEGADRLTLADQNEEGAKMLALQTRQELQVTGLSLAALSQFSVVQLVNG